MDMAFIGNFFDTHIVKDCIQMKKYEEKIIFKNKWYRRKLFIAEVIPGIHSGVLSWKF